MPLPPSGENKWWYLFYFATDRGQAGYAKYTKDFNRFIWQQASPKWTFDDETFERSATAFENPDFVHISLSNYRWYLGLESGERKYDELRRRSRHFQLSLVRQSRWKATRTAQRMLNPASMPRSTSAGTSIATSPAASGTICRRRLRKPSPRPSLMSTHFPVHR